MARTCRSPSPWGCAPPRSPPALCCQGCATPRSPSPSSLGCGLPRSPSPSTARAARRPTHPSPAQVAPPRLAPRSPFPAPPAHPLPLAAGVARCLPHPSPPRLRCLASRPAHPSLSTASSPSLAQVARRPDRSPSPLGAHCPGGGVGGWWRACRPSVSPAGVQQGKVWVGEVGRGWDADGRGRVNGGKRGEGVGGKGVIGKTRYGVSRKKHVQTVYKQTFFPCFSLTNEATTLFSPPSLASPTRPFPRCVPAGGAEGQHPPYYHLHPSARALHTKGPG